MKSAKLILLSGIIMIATFALAACDEHYGGDEWDYAAHAQPTTPRPLLPPRYTMPPPTQPPEMPTPAPTTPWTPPPTTAAITEPPVLAMVDWLAMDFGANIAPADERHYGWLYDIAAIRNLALTTHPRFAHDDLKNIAANIDMGHAFNAALAAILPNIPSMADMEIVAEIARAFRAIPGGGLSIGNEPFGHTSGMWHFDTDLHLPLEFRWIEGELILLYANADYAHAINHRLTAINGIPLADALAIFGDIWLYPDNYSLQRSFAENLDIWRLLVMGIGEDINRFTLANSAGASIEIAPEPVPTRYIRLQHGRNEDEAARPYRTHPRDEWFEFLEDEGIMYWRITHLMRQGSFAQNVARLIRDNTAAGLIIDLRYATGHVADFHIEMLTDRKLPYLDAAQIIVLVNSDTQGGAADFALHIRDIGGQIIGEPIAAHTSPYYITTRTESGWRMVDGRQMAFNELRIPGQLQLPHNPEFIFLTPNYLTRDPNTAPQTLTPHTTIHTTLTNWINNQDPIFDYAIGRLAP